MLPRWHSGKESSCQCRRHKRHRFNPWVRKMPWSRKQQPTPVLLLGKFHGQRNLVGYSPQGCKELDTSNWAHMRETETTHTDAFELWCWRKLLRVPWTARRSNQSILKEVSPEYSLERLMLKLQYYGHLMQRADSLEKILMFAKIDIKRRRGEQRMRWLDSIINSMHMNLSKIWEIVKNGEPGMLQSMGCKDLNKT